MDFFVNDQNKLLTNFDFNSISVADLILLDNINGEDTRHEAEEIAEIDDSEINNLLTYHFTPKSYWTLPEGIHSSKTPLKVLVFDFDGLSTFSGKYRSAKITGFSKYNYTGKLIRINAKSNSTKQHLKIDLKPSTCILTSTGFIKASELTSSVEIVNKFESFRITSLKEIPFSGEMFIFNITNPLSSSFVVKSGSSYIYIQGK